MHLYIDSTNWNYDLKDEQDQAWPKGVPRLVSRQKEKPHTIGDTSMKRVAGKMHTRLTDEANS